MKRKLTAFWLTALLCLPLSFSFTGCVAVAVGAGAGAVAYVRGELAGQVDASLREALDASNDTLASFKFVKVSEKSDALTGILVYRTAEDKKVEVKIERVTEKTSKVRIRVGLFGDESLSLQIWERIKGKI